MNTPPSLETAIKNKALQLGFDACGISTVSPLHEDLKKLNEWLDQGMNADMQYMERNKNKRANPTLLCEDAQSVISVLLNYYPNEYQPDNQHYKLSKYAYGTDYHYVIKEKLGTLQQFIREQTQSDFHARAFVDSAPVFDKAWAVKGGLGWIGKNSLLIHKKLGSFVFVGELIVSLKLTPDEAFEANHCGSCTACIEACPTQAIRPEGKVDARRCISYWTIETRDDIPEDIVPRLNRYIFGCDICQDVCPWNNKARGHNTPAFRLSEQLKLLTAADWEQMEKPQFKRLFKSSPLMRTGFKKIKKTLQQLQEHELRASTSQNPLDQHKKTEGNSSGDIPIRKA